MNIKCEHCFIYKLIEIQLRIAIYMQSIEKLKSIRIAIAIRPNLKIRLKQKMHTCNSCTCTCMYVYYS